MNSRKHKHRNANINSQKYSKLEKYPLYKEKARTPISSQNIPNSLRNNNLGEVKRSFKIDLTKMKRKEGKLNTITNNNFETFNNTPQNRMRKEESLLITNEEQRFINNHIKPEIDEDPQVFHREKPTIDSEILRVSSF